MRKFDDWSFCLGTFFMSVVAWAVIVGAGIGLIRIVKYIIKLIGGM